MRNKPKFKESIGDIVVAMLLSNKNSCRFRQIIRERKLARYKKESVQVALSRLHRNGYLNKSPSGWKLTSNGKLYTKKTILFSYITSPFNKDSTSNTIISFDIPGPKRLTRDWLRNQIKIFGYKMLQQSLWLGPGPLPTDFIKRLSELGIRENVKIFPIKKKDK